MASIRAFLAADPPREAIDKLARCVERLRRPVEEAGLRVTWVRPEALHVTLKFFGNIEEEAIGPIAAALAALRPAALPEMLLAGVSWFPATRRPRVIFAGVRGPEGLVLLQRSIEDLLAPLGHEREDRPFRPHVTLGRVKDRARGAASIETQLGTFKDECFGPEATVSEIVLYESRQGRTGMEYIARARVGVAT